MIHKADLPILANIIEKEPECTLHFACNVMNPVDNSFLRGNNLICDHVSAASLATDLQRRFHSRLAKAGEDFWNQSKQ